jgi:hypothetical protein
MYKCPYCQEEMKISQSYMADTDLYTLSCFNHIKLNYDQQTYFSGVSFNFSNNEDSVDIEFQSYVVPITNLIFYSVNSIDKVPFLYLSYNNKINLDITWLSLTPKQIINKAKLLLTFI